MVLRLIVPYAIMMRMPGTTLRLDAIEHKMLQILCSRRGVSQNQLIADLLRAEFAQRGITREQVEQMMAEPNRFWSALGRSVPTIPDDIHSHAVADLAALDA